GQKPLHEIFRNEKLDLFPYRIRPEEGAEHKTSPSGAYVVDIDVADTNFAPHILDGVQTLNEETLEECITLPDGMG
ncbi:MAG: hypothetical protein GY927_12945, partial [bacterium]|nr:hypothetical protein [bacterium]